MAYKNTQDNKIISLLLERNEEAIKLLEATYGNYCMTIINRILTNCQDATECMNDVLLKIWNSIPPNKPVNLGGYISKITRNTSLNIYEKNNSKKRAQDAWSVRIDELADCISGKSEIDEHINYELLLDALTDYLSHKNQTHRKIFIQRYFYFLELEEIALQVNMNQSAVRTILSRMRKELKHELLKKGIWT